MLPSISCSPSCKLASTPPGWLDTPPTFLLLQLFLTKYTPFMVFPADAPPGATLAVATNVLIKVLRSSAHTNATRVAAAACLTRLAGEGPARTCPEHPACCQLVWQQPASSTGRQRRFQLAGTGPPAFCSQCRGGRPPEQRVQVVGEEAACLAQCNCSASRLFGAGGCANPPAPAHVVDARGHALSCRGQLHALPPCLAGKCSFTQASWQT